jgi:tetratricopeptide (TPR) repeat protein
MVYYLLGYFDSLRGNFENALANYKRASEMAPAYCFPNRNEEVLVLQDAIKLNPSDTKAAYYLGNFWYANQQYDQALTCWEQSASIDGLFPTVLRNLSQIYYNKKKNPQKALDLLENAFALDNSDARILMELDQLYKKTGRNSNERLEFLEQNLSLVEVRDDLFLERITLYNQIGDFHNAKELLADHKFHPWEGGEGKVIGQYLLCHKELAKKSLNEGQYYEALELLETAKTYPQNLGEGKLFGTQENDINYYIGCAYEGLGNIFKANNYFEKATYGLLEPSLSFFYNDQNSDMIFYKGLAWHKLGNETMAQECFTQLIKYGENQKVKKMKIDYFAVSLPDMQIWEDDLDRRNLINCDYLIGLGCLGSGSLSRAKKYFHLVLSLDVNHVGALIQLKKLELQLLKN